MDKKIALAGSAAAMAVQIDPDVTQMQVFDAEYWPCIGGVIVHPDRQPIEDRARGIEALIAVMDTLAAFVRDNPAAPLEALYRHAGGLGIHQRPADGFDDIPAAFRIAYAVFRSTLLEADRVFAEEEARAAAKARAEAVQPPVIVPREDTILAQHGSIFDRIGDAPEMVNLGGPVVAASEGEGGDADVSLAGTDQGPNDLDAGEAVAPAAGGPGEDQPATSPVSGPVAAEDRASAGGHGHDRSAETPADPAAVSEGEGPGAGPDADASDAGEADVDRPAGDAGGAPETPPDPADDTDGAPPAPVTRRKK